MGRCVTVDLGILFYAFSKQTSLHLFPIKKRKQKTFWVKVYRVLWLKYLNTKCSFILWLCWLCLLCILDRYSGTDLGLLTLKRMNPKPFPAPVLLSLTIRTPSISPNSLKACLSGSSSVSTNEIYKMPQSIQDYRSRLMMWLIINPLTPKKSWVILQTVYSTSLLMLHLRIWYWIN